MTRTSETNSHTGRERTNAGARHTTPVAQSARGASAEEKYASLQTLQRSIGNAAFSALVSESGSLQHAQSRSGSTGLPIVVQRDLTTDVNKVLRPVDKKAKIDYSSLPPPDPAKILQAEAIRVLKILGRGRPAQITTTLEKLGRPAVEKILSSIPNQDRASKAYVAVLLAQPNDWMTAYMTALPKGGGLTADQNRLLKLLFDTCPDTRLALLKSIMSTRFDLQVGGAITATDAHETAIDWDAPGLRKMYPVLAALPAAHVAQNKELISMGRYENKQGIAGYYWKQEGAIAYTNTTDKQSSKGDPLHGVNRFDKVVRHEVGHAVDQEMGWTKNESAASKRGGWFAYNAGYGAAVDAMLADSTGAISKLRSSKKSDAKAVLVWLMANRASGEDKLKEQFGDIGWYVKMDDEKKNEILSDQVVRAVRLGLMNPWYNSSAGGVPVGNYIYQESYANQWVRYEQAARTRKVSQYQFRAPGEWFAEAYAAYYEPKSQKGSLLKKIDPDTKTYFDEEVDTRGASR